MKLLTCIFCMILGGIIAMSLLCGCTNIREGMMTTLKWKMNAIKDNMDEHSNSYPALPLPLHGKMDMFDKNISSPFCHSQYSRGEGQLCVNRDQLDYINRRGGNRAPIDGTASSYGSDF